MTLNMGSDKLMISHDDSAKIIERRKSWIEDNLFRTDGFEKMGKMVLVR